MDKEQIQTCKQGWLQKRGKSFKFIYIFTIAAIHLSLLFVLGEHIKTWRPRYFVLRSDGNFIGYNSQPSSDYLVEPNNTFYIKGLF